MSSSDIPERLYLNIDANLKTKKNSLKEKDYLSADAAVA
jgi:hypothetical protein